MIKNNILLFQSKSINVDFQIDIHDYLNIALLFGSNVIDLKLNHFRIGTNHKYIMIV